jgi:hypothetical protein
MPPRREGSVQVAGGERSCVVDELREPRRALDLGQIESGSKEAAEASEEHLGQRLHADAGLASRALELGIRHNGDQPGEIDKLHLWSR